MTISQDQIKMLQDALNNNHIESNNTKKKIIVNSTKISKIKKISIKQKKVVKSVSVSEIEKEAILKRAMQRAENQSAGISQLLKEKKQSIPDYQEGSPKPGWFTDDDWKKMRSQDYAAMKKNHRD